MAVNEFGLGPEIAVSTGGVAFPLMSSEVIHQVLYFLSGLDSTRATPIMLTF